MIKKPKKWGEMSDLERRVWANDKKKYYEKRLAFITKVCQKLSDNKDFTPIEMERIDLIDLQTATVKDLSAFKFDGKLVQK